MKKRTLPTANLGLLERLYKYGVIWAVLFVIFFAVHSNNNYFFRALSSLCFVGMEILMVLFINKVLIEHLLKKERVVFFILLSILVLPVWAMASALTDVFLVPIITKDPYSEVSAFSGLLMTFIVRLLWFLVTYAVVVIFYYQRKENETKIASDKLQSEKLDMELRYLKSQINPHFLFNALNNIYSMVYTHDDNAADGVLKLSEMLRYVLVDCQAETIPLSKEIKYVENFIDFQMMRMNGDRDVKLMKDIENVDYMIAPMLLQPVIENSFKYSRLETHPDGYVHISICQKNNKFTFMAQNSIAPNAVVIGTGTEVKKSGIGLKNVRQRLMLHYAESYVFDVEQNENLYKVTIAI